MFPSIFYRRGIQSARDSAQFSVYHKGVLVVDLAGGYADDEAGWTMGRDSLIVTASTIKAVSAFCIALLVDRYGRNGTGHLAANVGTTMLVYSHLYHNENKHEYALLQCSACCQGSFWVWARPMRGGVSMLLWYYALIGWGRTWNDPWYFTMQYIGKLKMAKG